MTYESLQNWLNQLKDAWENKNPEAAASLFAYPVIYQEDPFSIPVHTKEEVCNIWEEIKDQQNISVDFAIACISQNRATVTWSASYSTPSDPQPTHVAGIYILTLTSGGLCREFHQWWQQASLQQP